jgi:hypothetical protein
MAAGTADCMLARLRGWQPAALGSLALVGMEDAGVMLAHEVGWKEGQQRIGHGADQQPTHRGVDRHRHERPDEWQQGGDERGNDAFGHLQRYQEHAYDEQVERLAQHRDARGAGIRTAKAPSRASRPCQALGARASGLP